MDIGPPDPSLEPVLTPPPSPWDPPRHVACVQPVFLYFYHMYAFTLHIYSSFE